MVTALLLRPLILATLLLAAAPAAPATRGEHAPACAATLGELRSLFGEPALARHWSEVSMDDGKPLRVVIDERNGALWIEFTKTGVGPWAEMSGVVCPAGGDFELRVERDGIRLGSAAGWPLTLALGSGGVFALRHRAPDQLQIDAPGWSGRFVPAAKN